ncbi:hypothetical protein A2U01_0073350, partial [Trifolium medium]|nr:hypothetical protein [Trifolium medium]
KALTLLRVGHCLLQSEEMKEDLQVAWKTRMFINCDVSAHERNNEDEVEKEQQPDRSKPSLHKKGGLKCVNLFLSF